MSGSERSSHASCKCDPVFRKERIRRMNDELRKYGRGFAAGLTFLEQRGRLASAITRGIPIRLWLCMARHLCASVGSPESKPIKLAPFSTSQRSGTGNFEFEVLEAIAAGAPVLISIDGPLDHYSVICGYSPTRFRFFDSYGYRWLSRQHCTFDESRTKRHMLTG